jgi:hypothetical protein
MCAICRGKANIRARRGSISRLSQVPEVKASTLQEGWTSRAAEIVKGLYEEFFLQLPERGPPCPYAFCVGGSGARREACPYSDLDAFIVLDPGAKRAEVDAFDSVSLQVMLRLEEIEFDSTRHNMAPQDRRLLYQQVAKDLQEVVRNNNNKSPFNQQKPAPKRYVDDNGKDLVLITGLVFCQGGSNPGAWVNLQSGRARDRWLVGSRLPCELTATAVDLAKAVERNLKKRKKVLGHVMDGLMESGFGFGTEQLHRDYLRELDKVTGDTCNQFSSSAGLGFKREGGLKAIEAATGYTVPAQNATRFNIKTEFYRLPQFVVKGLAWFYGIDAVATSDQLQGLVAGRHMSKSNEQIFRRVLNFLTVRVASHLKAGEEADWVRTSDDKENKPGDYTLKVSETIEFRERRRDLIKIKVLASSFLEEKRKAFGSRTNPFWGNGF